MKSTLLTFFLLVLSLLFSMPVLAQTHRASVRGTLYDSNKAVIAGATVTLRNIGTRESRSMTTGDDGVYAISSLPPGAYQLEIEAAGFRKFSERIDLLVNEVLGRDLTLSAGPPESELTVEEPSKVKLKTDSASLGTVIENRQITGLPLDGRNFYELSLLVPGAVPPAQGSAGSVRGDFAFSVNGAREDANNFLLDGVYNIDPKLNTFGVRPSVDAIREFEMLTSTYRVEMLRSTQVDPAIGDRR